MLPITESITYFKLFHQLRKLCRHDCVLALKGEYICECSFWIIHQLVMKLGLLIDSLMRYFSENICMLSRSGSCIFRHFLIYQPITIRQKPVMVSNQKPSLWDGDFLYFSRCALRKIKNIQHPQKCNRLHHIAILLASSKSLEVVFILHNRAKNKLGMFVVSCTIIRPKFILVILFLCTVESVSSNVK